MSATNDQCSYVMFVDERGAQEMREFTARTDGVDLLLAGALARIEAELWILLQRKHGAEFADRYLAEPTPRPAIEIFILRNTILS